MPKIHAFKLLLTIGAFLAGLGPAPASATRVLSESAPSLFVYTVELEPRTHEFDATTILTPGADPVMHLLRVNGDGSVTQVKYSDDYDGGLGSFISWTQTGGTETYMLVIRAKSQGTSGLGIVRHNGVSLGLYVIGGRLLQGFVLDAGATDTVWAVPQPGGSVNPIQFRMNASGDQILDMATPGPAGATVMGWYPSSRILLGTPGSSYNGYPRAGYTRLYSNDATDSDGDGLGDLLEAELGTCVNSACYDGTYLSSDSDRDGLPDGEEVLGQGGNLPDGSDDIGFPRWGANPLHKDVFVEVDYVTRGDSNGWATHHPFGGAGGNPMMSDWDTSLRSAFEVGPADQLKNPDNEDGVALHLDIYRNPINATEHRYSDYGSPSAQRIVTNQSITLRGVPSYPWTVSLKVEEFSDSFEIVPTANWIPLSVAAAIGNGLLSFGESIDVSLHVVDGYPTLTVSTTEPGRHFEISLDPDDDDEAPLLQVTTQRVSEASFASDIYNNDEGHFDAVRRGRFRYAVINSSAGGGQAHRRAYVAARSYLTFAHELGHTLGLEHWGRTQWLTGDEDDTDSRGNEFNCVPWYQSVMNYAYAHSNSRYQFSAVPWSQSVSRNPRMISETNVIPGVNQSVWLGGPPYNLETDATHADLDRNGSFDSWVQAPVRFGGSSCRAFDTGRQPLDYDDALDPVVGPVSLVRAQNRLYAFYTRKKYVGNTGPILYRVATLGDSLLSGCTGEFNPIKYPSFGSIRADGCLDWSGPEQELHPYFIGHGVSAAIRDGQIWLTTRTVLGQIALATATIGSNGTLYLDTQEALTGIGSTDNTPTIQSVYRGAYAPVFAIVYVKPGTPNELRWLVRKPGGWDDQSMLAVSLPQGIEPVGIPTLVSWPEPTNTSFTPSSERRTCALVPVRSTDNNEPERHALTYICHTQLFGNLWWWTDRTSTLFSYAPNPPYCSSNYLKYTPTQCIPVIAPGTQTAAAVRTSRNWTGGPSSPTTGLGNLVVAFSHPLGSPSDGVDQEARPRVMWSNAISAGSRSLTQASISSWRDWWVNEWHKVPPLGGLALLDEAGIGSMYGLMTRYERPSPNAPKYQTLTFYPYADGTEHIDLRVGSDFSVMEDYICRNLFDDEEDQEDYCGPDVVLE